jgi:hypothetical protein
MLIERMIRAARLDPDVYNEIETDPSASPQAAAVVLIVAVCALLGSAISSGRAHSMPGAAINAIALWLIWSFVILIAGRLFGGTADFGQVMRTLAFARAPGVLALFSFVPVVGGLAALVAWVWTWLATVVAVREAMDFDTGRAVLTVILPTFVMFILAGAVVLLFGLSFATLYLLGV